MQTESDWIEFIAYAAGAENLVTDYGAITKETLPTTFDALGDEVLTDPDAVLLAYLQWATVAHWGANGVPVEFWEQARLRWPNVRLPKFQKE